MGSALAFAAVAAVLLGPALTGGFFSDDWELQLVDPASHIARAFGESRPYEMYRPLQLLAVAISQTIFGDSTTLPVHLLNLATHAALAALVLRALSALGAPRSGAVLGGLYLAVSQLSASAVGGNDTLSLTLGTFFGSLALWWLSPLSRRSESGPALAVAAFALALLAKESSLGYLPLLCLVAWLRWRESERGALKASGVTVCLAAVTLLYFALRSHSGATLPNLATGHQMRVGPNLAVNAGLFAFAALVPIPTTWVYLGAKAGEWLWPAAGAISALGVLVFGALGLARAGKLRWLAAALVTAGALLGPVLPLIHVSELYAYAVLPLTAILFGWSAGTLLSPSESNRTRWAAGAFAVFVLASNALATHLDAVGLARSGAAAAVIRPQLVEIVRALPPGATAVWVDPPQSAPTYSGFQAQGLALATLTPRQILEHLGRDDVRARGVGSGEPLPDPCPGCVFFTLADGNRVVPLDPAPIP